MKIMDERLIYCYIDKFVNSFSAYANACGISFVEKDIDDILALNL